MICGTTLVLNHLAELRCPFKRCGFAPNFNLILKSPTKGRTIFGMLTHTRLGHFQNNASLGAPQKDTSPVDAYSVNCHKQAFSSFLPFAARCCGHRHQEPLWPFGSDPSPPHSKLKGSASGRISTPCWLFSNCPYARCANFLQLATFCSRMKTSWAQL